MSTYTPQVVKSEIIEKREEKEEKREEREEKPEQPSLPKAKGPLQSVVGGSSQTFKKMPGQSAINPSKESQGSHYQQRPERKDPEASKTPVFKNLEQIEEGDEGD